MLRRRLATLWIGVRFAVSILGGVRVMTEMGGVRFAGLAMLGTRRERELQWDHEKQKEDE